MGTQNRNPARDENRGMPKNHFVIHNSWGSLEVCAMLARFSNRIWRVRQECFVSQTPNLNTRKKGSQNASAVFQECFRRSSEVLQECFKNVSRVKFLTRDNLRRSRAVRLDSPIQTTRYLGAQN